MMDFIRQYQTAIIFVAIVGALFGGYQYFFAAPTGSVVQVTKAPGLGGDQDLIGLLFELKGIRLDNAIFDDPLYQSLQNFGRDLVSEPVGRVNPFAPLGASAAPALKPVP